MVTPKPPLTARPDDLSNYPFLYPPSFDLKKIYELFPGGPAKGACKIAGLPKPTGCV